MHIREDLANLRVNRSVVLTIGVFDGVHLGHQHLIGGVVRRAREIDGLAVVLTFHPHPGLVLGPATTPAYLTSLQERLSLIAGLGVDLTATLRFTKALSQVSALDFVTALCGVFNLVELRVGPDFALGHKRLGTIPVLREMGQQFGFDVSVAQPWRAEDLVVSSTRVRQLVREGDVAHAAQLLSRPYAVSGRVVAGERRGRTLGFPTANLETNPEILLPADGVYAVHARVDDRCLAAVCSIGQRPSFANASRTFEVHLLDFEGDVYGKVMTVWFAHRLRDEVRFESVSALAEQIGADSARARSLLAVAAPPLSCLTGHAPPSLHRS